MSFIFDEELANQERTEKDVSGQQLLNEYRDDDGKLEGFQLFVIDDRKISDILVDWQVEVGVSVGDFIKHLELEGRLSAKEYTEIVTGQAAVGEGLAEHLAEQADKTVASRTIIKNRAKQSRRDRPHHVVDIDPLEKAEVGAAADAELIKYAPYVTQSDSRTVRSPFYIKLVAQLGKILPDNEKGDLDDHHKNAEKLADYLDIDVWELQGFAPLSEKRSAQEVADKLIEALYDDPLSDKAQAMNGEAVYHFDMVAGIDVAGAIEKGAPKPWGEVLAKLRINNGWSQPEFGKQVASEMQQGSSYLQSTVSSWENVPFIPNMGKDKSIPYNRIMQKTDAVADVLGLTDKNKEAFVRHKWQKHDELCQKAEAEAESFGDLLQALRMQQYLSQKEFADKIPRISGKKPTDVRIHEDTVHRWEINAKLPTEANFQSITKVLLLTPAQKEKMTALYWKAHDKEWEQKLDQSEGAGQMLQACVALKRQSYKDFGEGLARHIGRDKAFTRNTIAKYINEESLPDKKTVEGISSYVGLSAAQHNDLMDKHYNQHDEVWKEKLSQAKTPGPVLRACRELTHLNRDEAAELVSKNIAMTPIRLCRLEEGKAIPNPEEVNALIETFSMGEERSILLSGKLQEKRDQVRTQGTVRKREERTKMTDNIKPRGTSAVSALDQEKEKSQMRGRG